ncbi:hypothetical protein [Micromonospora sp. NBC_01638]|uniref:hypothetical protein n=1 Tax=Micromonospora sp. NBC_01638 TaxID=2975982 RepID=UPI003866F201|nr:hypothetical protein OG811_32015 [Micromonospora sp. NBC_01638]
MARRPANFTWIDFTPDQVELLELLDYLGNNGWARNSQTEAAMPKLMWEFADAGVGLVRIKEAMAAIGRDPSEGFDPRPSVSA